MLDFQQTEQFFIHVVRVLVVLLYAIPDVFSYVHVWKQCKILKHIADLPVTGRYENTCGSVEKHFPVANDSACIRFYQAGNRA